MTELQASLMAIGGVIVVGVISYNKWQEWRAKKSVEQAFSPLQDDVLMGGGSAQSPSERQEPVLSPFEGPDAVVAHAQDEVLHRDAESPDSHVEADGHDSAPAPALAAARPAFIEAHAKLRPVDFSSEGIYLCGTAHSPKLISESITQALAASSAAVPGPTSASRSGSSLRG